MFRNVVDIRNKIGYVFNKSDFKVLQHLLFIYRSKKQNLYLYLI